MQCMFGKVNMGGYVIGNVFVQVGVISGFDMMVEVMLIKLYYLFSQQLDVDVICVVMQ